MTHTFDEICRIEPRMRKLMDSIPARMHVDNGFWRNWSNIKLEMMRLVGFESDNLELGSCGDYDTAYRALFKEANRCEDIEEAATVPVVAVAEPVPCTTCDGSGEVPSGYNEFDYCRECHPYFHPEKAVK